MTAARWFLGFVWVFCIVATWVRGQVDGLTLLGTLLFFVWLGACGVFSRSWHMADPEMSARLSAVDEQIRFADDVRADLARLESRD